MAMLAPPTKAEIRIGHLDATSPSAFRFTWSAMPVMVMTMSWAGAVVDEDKPAWPTWPPGTPEDRKATLDDAVLDPSLEATLTVAERRATIHMRGARTVMFSTPSKHKGKVPSFKFRWNDGYIVTKAECAVIATKLRAFAKTVDASKLGELDAIYRESQKPVAGAAKRRGDLAVTSEGGLGMTVDDYKAWVLEWATYNEIASHHRGYVVH